MAEPQQKTMTADEFLVWNLSQEERYELIDGVPVPLRAMSGASNVHDIIAVNIIVALGNKLRGSRCRPTTADTAVRTAIERMRRPDITIECGPADRKSYEARNPVAVFEILSPSTRKVDRLIKLGEYQRHPSIRHIVVIDPDLVSVLVYTRDDAGVWNSVPSDRPEDEIDLPAVPVALTLAEIYAGVPWDEAGEGSAGT
ncbi:MAG: Uma2 family endonuclease [Hyphomicrobiaceae bacterium]